MPLTGKRLNWITLPADINASAPMLQWIPFAAWPDFLLAAGYPAVTPFTAVLRGLSIPFRPDVTNPYGPGDSAEEYNGAAFHELGHTSHYANVGETYWFQLRNHIIVNNGYGSPGNFFPGSNEGHAALAEALGFYSGARFGGTFAGGEFNVFPDAYIPAGLCWDLEDNTPGENLREIDNDGLPDPDGIILANDNVQGFTPAMFFGEAVNSVNSIQDLGDALRDNQLPGTTNNEVDFNALINYWDVL